MTGQPQAELIEELCYASACGSGGDGQRIAYTEPHCRRAFRGLASALACLAEKGVCHGNVRPETVLLMRRGDFSSVRCQQHFTFKHNNMQVLTTTCLVC